MFFFVKFTFYENIHYFISCTLTLDLIFSDFRYQNTRHCNTFELARSCLMFEKDKKQFLRRFFLRSANIFAFAQMREKTKDGEKTQTNNGIGRLLKYSIYRMYNNLFIVC